MHSRVKLNYALIRIASIVLICKSLWIKASAKWLNVNAMLKIREKQREHRTLESQGQSVTDRQWQVRDLCVFLSGTHALVCLMCSVTVTECFKYTKGLQIEQHSNIMLFCWACDFPSVYVWKISDILIRFRVYIGQISSFLTWSKLNLCHLVHVCLLWAHVLLNADKTHFV